LGTRSYAVDPLDQREQDRERDDPEHDRDYIHELSMDVPASRPHYDPGALRYDFVTVSP